MSGGSGFDDVGNNLRDSLLSATGCKCPVVRDVDVGSDVGLGNSGRLRDHRLSIVISR